MLVQKIGLISFALVMSAPLSFGAEPISPASHIAVAPDVAVNGRGQIALMWVDQSPEQQEKGENHDNHLSSTDLYVAISRDGGTTFGAPTKVNNESGVVWGQTVSRPRIVGSATGAWHVAYAANEIHPTLKKVALTTHYTRSVDDGKSFEAARRVSTLTDADLSEIIHGGFISAAAFSTLAVAPDGSVHVIWIDTRNMKGESGTGALYAATSRDNGKSFGADRELLAAGVCPCCQLMAIADSQSNILIGSRQVSADGFRQSTVARIPAQSESVSTVVKTGGAPWQIAGCPLKPTAVASKGERIYTAAYNGGEAKPGVYFTMSTDSGVTYSPAAAVHPDAAVSDAPSIAVNDKYALLAWHGKTTGQRRVFYRMYDLDGKPVGAITELPTATESAQTPVVSNRADGKFQIAWQQANRIYTAILPAAPAEANVVRN